MNSFICPVRLRPLAPLAVGFLGSMLAACTTISVPAGAGAADLQAKSDEYAKTAADYRARMRVDEKHSIQFFTQANRWDQKAQAYHLAAVRAAAEPTPPR